MARQQHINGKGIGRHWSRGRGQPGGSGVGQEGLVGPAGQQHQVNSWVGKAEKHSSCSSSKTEGSKGSAVAVALRQGWCCAASGARGQ